MSMIKDPIYIFGAEAPAAPTVTPVQEDHSALWLGIAAALGVSIYLLARDSKKPEASPTIQHNPTEPVIVTSEETIAQALGEAIEELDETPKKKKRKSRKKD